MCKGIIDVADDNAHSIAVFGVPDTIGQGRLSYRPHPGIMGGSIVDAIGASGGFSFGCGGVLRTRAMKEGAVGKVA